MTPNFPPSIHQFDSRLINRQRPRLARFATISSRRLAMGNPGHGSASYYWFKEDGTLAGAGLMDTGHRCGWVDITANDIRSADSKIRTEVHLVLKTLMNVQAFLIARFVLEADGLKLISLTGADGKKHDNDGFHVGRSLVP